MNHMELSVIIICGDELNLYTTFERAITAIIEQVLNFAISIYEL